MERSQHDRSLGATAQRIRDAAPGRVTALALVAVALIASAAPAQDGPQQDRSRDRSQLQEQPRDETRAQTQLRLRQRIEDCPGATAEQRRLMLENVEQGLRLGLDGETLEAMIPARTASGRDVGHVLRFQRKILGAAADGLPIEALRAKVREGQMKGVGPEAIAAAVEDLERHLRAADRVVVRAGQGGVEVPQSPQQRREVVRVMARAMRSGLDEPALEQLRRRACERARDGSCTAGELAAAAALAGQLREAGIGTGRAVGIAGEALHGGYGPEHMSRVGLMAMNAHQHRRGADLADDLEGCLQDGMSWREMERHLTQAGWLGPAETGGHGGRDSDHLGGGPGGQGGAGGHGGGGGGGGGPGGAGGGGAE